MNLDSASASIKPLILSARYEIIFNTDWVADGIIGHELDENGNIVKTLPNFSEVFPSDWSVPVFQETLDVPVLSPFAQSGYQYIDTLFQDSVLLKAPPMYADTPAFYTFNTKAMLATGDSYRYTKVTTQGIQFVSDATFNVGYTNAATGASLGYDTNMPSGHILEISIPSTVSKVSVRASTYDGNEYWTMIVRGYS